MQYGMAAYAILRDSEAEAQHELERITDVTDLPAGYANFDQRLSGTQLERALRIEEYSVSNRNAARGAHLAPYAGIHIEPLGAYSRKWKSVAELPRGATVAIPTEPSNGGRALLLRKRLA